MTLLGLLVEEALGDAPPIAEATPGPGYRVAYLRKPRNGPAREGGGLTAVNSSRYKPEGSSW